ncbi:MAG: T9SS type A sorting domain-containing protein [Bacteroidetes bacterium]|nr:T9SS type A sorting domain-containing protein [Bacteroidota bacterium]
MTKKNKSKPIALLVAAMLMGTMSYAQSIYFNYTDGTNATYNLQDVRKITFTDDVMNLHLTDGAVFSWNVSTIGYYQYDETILNTQEWLNQANAWQVRVFPNPTSTVLNVRFQLPKEDQVSISLSDLQGKLLLTKNIGTKIAGEYLETLDLSGLPQGNYLCRISGQQQTITKQVIKH